MTPHRILLVEDDKAFRRVYGKLLRERGYEVLEADDRPSAQAALRSGAVSLVLLDLMLPPDGTAAGGLRQLADILAAQPGLKVIVASGAGDVRTMIQAVRSGAHDFLTKPVDPDVLLIVVERALARGLLESQVEGLRASLAQASPEGALIGASPAFLRALEMAQRVALTGLPVLLTGENGTGKELFARAIHRHSPRQDRPFVVVNCGALTESLLESSLFGHVRGAFTGAVKDRKGLFAEAHTGTLFLDEVGDMPLSLQVKILRALESGEVLPVGADRPIHADVRLVSATNRDLLALQGAGEFREDLYWRIRGAEIVLPPLRQRPGDLPLLAAHWLNKAAALCSDGRPKTLSERSRAALLEHAWPGNLRELKFEMQRATVLAGLRPEVEPEDFAFFTAAGSPEPRSGDTTLAEKLEALERREIEAALERFHGNRTHAADFLGLSRQGLLKKMARYGFT